MASRDRISSCPDVSKRHASVTFSDSSTIINNEAVVTPPADVFSDNKPGSRVIRPDPFIDEEELSDDDDEIDPLGPQKKHCRSQSRISDFRDHGVRAPSIRDPSEDSRLKGKRSSSGSIKPLKFSSADGRAYGTVGRTKGRRQSLVDRGCGTRCSICRLERQKILEPASAGSRAGFIMFLVVMNTAFLTTTVFCVVWPAAKREWDKAGYVVVPISLWLALTCVTASSWRVPRKCECPPRRRSSNMSKSKSRQSSGPLFPKPGLWLDRPQSKPWYESDSEPTEV